MAQGLDKVYGKAINKIHGGKKNSVVTGSQGASAFLGNPMTATGKDVMGSMKKQYGAKKGKQVFYASINKGKSGTSKWHK